jgi:crotonobetaine/carnitine-CoA ligase
MDRGVDSHSAAGLIGDVFKRRATSAPEVPLIKCGQRWLNAREVDVRADALAAGLMKSGVVKGDRVGLMTANRIEVVELFVACARVGAIFVPFNGALKGAFLEHQLRDSDPAFVFVDDTGRQAFSQLSGNQARLVALDDAAGDSITYSELVLEGEEPLGVQLHAGDVSSLMYTSGTTGFPKGCMIPQGYYVRNARSGAETGWVHPGDRVFTALPLFHMGGHQALMLAIVNDASIAIQSAFHASSFLSEARQDHASVILGVGPMGMAILAQPASEEDGTFGFRLAFWTPMHPDHQALFERRFNTPVIAEGYGQTECAPITLSSLHGMRKHATAGKAVSYLEVRILDEHDAGVLPGQVGEVAVRPREPNVMFKGYWRRPEDTLEAFRNLWYHTGDLGQMDEDGFLTFVDRRKDVIRRRGENVSSFELELVISRHPLVAVAAVTAVPSPLGEDDIRLTVVPAGSGTLVPEDLYAWFVQQLPRYAIPRFVEIRESVPLSATGRVAKHLIREEDLASDSWDFEAMNLTSAKRD